MRIRHTVTAPLFSVFSVDAFNAQVGERVVVHVHGQRREGTLIRADVIDLGQRVEITLDVPDLRLELGREQFSIVDEGSFRHA